MESLYEETEWSICVAVLVDSESCLEIRLNQLGNGRLRTGLSYRGRLTPGTLFFSSRN